jgi:ABC-type phosphate/phosphonate transport system substrate-binding protein
VSGSAFVSYLGSNSLPIARALGASLSRELGLDLTFDLDATWTDRRAAIDRGTPSLYWMCGLLTVELIDSGRLDAEIVAAPVFPGRGGPTYRSVLVARRTGGTTTIADLAGRRLAVNETGSWSGYHALRVHLAELGLLDPFFGEIVVAGSHDASIDLLLAGDADCASVDGTVWTDRSATDPDLGALHVVEQTRDWPAPPFSVARRLEQGVREAIAASLIGSAPPGLDAIEPATSADYDPIRRGVETSARVRW